MKRYIQVQDPGLTCLGVTPINSISIDTFGDRVRLDFYTTVTSVGNELVQVGNTLEIDLDTWKVLISEERL